MDWVLDVARAAVYRYGIRGLVIDPYNELDHQRPASMNETEYVSQMLTKVKRFAQTTGVHVWFVAHPRQLREWKGQAPNLYDISGSAHFINKADNGIVVHRDRDPDSPDHNKVGGRGRLWGAAVGGWGGWDSGSGSGLCLLNCWRSAATTTATTATYPALACPLPWLTLPSTSHPLLTGANPGSQGAQQGCGHHWRRDTRV